MAGCNKWFLHLAVIVNTKHSFIYQIFHSPLLLLGLAVLVNNFHLKWNVLAIVIQRLKWWGFLSGQYLAHYKIHSAWSRASTSTGLSPSTLTTFLLPLAHMGPEHASREKKLTMVIFLIFVQKNVSTIRFQEIKIRPLKGFEKMRFLCFYIIGV